MASISGQSSGFGGGTSRYQSQNHGKAQRPVAKIAGMVLFSVWALVLSGLFDQTFSSPGVLQALELRSLLSEKQSQVAALEAELRSLEEQYQRLDKNEVAIEREIRKTLGYAASDEIIFDFSHAFRKEQEGAADHDRALPTSPPGTQDQGQGGRILGLKTLRNGVLPVAGRPATSGGRSL